MSSSKMAFLAAAATGTAIYLLFFRGGEDDDKRDNSSGSPTNTRSPTTYDGDHPDFYESNRSSSYARHFQRTCWTSTHVPPSYLQPSSHTCTIEATAKTQPSPTTSDDDEYRCPPSLASSGARVPRGASTTSDAPSPHVFPPPQLTSTQHTANITTTADGAHTQATVQRTPTPDFTCVHDFGYPESHLTHSPTLTSSSDSDFLGIAPITCVPPPSQEAVPNTEYVIEFEAAATVEDMKTATELRERARCCKREMRVARNLAKSARKRGNYGAEWTHRQDAITHEGEMKSLNKRAAKIIFREKNKALKKGLVDLHGLYVVEAMEYARKELQSASDQDDDEICFIVGKGLHSFDGQSKLRPHLQMLCDANQLTYSLDPKNAGILRVQMN